MTHPSPPNHKATPVETGENLAPAGFEPMNHPGHLVRRLHQICMAVFLDAARDYELTHVQFATLLAIQHSPGSDQTRIGKLVALDRQNTSTIVNRLVQKGLVERQQKDKRSSALYITGAAKALIDVMEPRVDQIDDIILGPLDDNERSTLLHLLRKLVVANNSLSRAPQSAND